MNDDDEKHQRVLEAAILRALADVRPDLTRIDPEPVRLVRDRVHLAGELRNREGMRHVDRLNGDECRLPSDGHEHGDMDLATRYDPEGRLPAFPPPLITDDGELLLVI